MVYGSGADSTLLGDLFASSSKRLYSSRGSVTFPAGGTGGAILSCANEGTLIRNATTSSFFSPTCLFLALIIQIGTWRLVFASEFGNKIERRPQTSKRNPYGKNPCGFSTLQSEPKIVDQGLCGNLSNFYFGLGDG